MCTNKDYFFFFSNQSSNDLFFNNQVIVKKINYVLTNLKCFTICRHDTKSQS